MAGLIDYPQVVQEALRTFGDLLPNEPQRRHFAEYLTGLFVAERKNVTAIDRVCARNIPGTFTFDSYFTNAPILNHIHGKQLGNGQPRGYVGSLKFNRKLEYKGRLLKASELAASIDPAIRKLLVVGERRQW